MKSWQKFRLIKYCAVRSQLWKFQWRGPFRRLELTIAHRCKSGLGKSDCTQSHPQAQNSQCSLSSKLRSRRRREQYWRDRWCADDGRESCADKSWGWKVRAQSKRAKRTYLLIKETVIRNRDLDRDIVNRILISIRLRNQSIWTFLKSLSL